MIGYRKSYENTQKSQTYFRDMADRHDRDYDDHAFIRW